MKVLAYRVDALTVAGRVILDPSLVQALAEHAKRARDHGRVRFSWAMPVPVVGDEEDLGVAADTRRETRGVHIPVADAGLRLASSRKAGERLTERTGVRAPLRHRWADEHDRSRLVSKNWGEIRWSQSLRSFVITNEPICRIRIDPYAPGGVGKRDCVPCGGTGLEGGICPACRGDGRWLSDVDGLYHRCVACEGKGRIAPGACAHCDGKGAEEVPGFTVEIIWYAAALADWRLQRCLDESAAIFSNLGEVLETRLRRVDLCADVEGWEFSIDDVGKLAKKPRARWTYDDDGVPTEGDRKVRAERERFGDRRLLKKRRSAKERADDGAQIYGTGVLDTRRITGISVGRGGAIMMRIYDKRTELERPDKEQDREEEEKRWRDPNEGEGAWDGVSAVTRVEFQIRGVALKELGLRDPHACVEPITRLEPYTSASGRKRTKVVVTGERILTAREADGREVQATIVHRLDDIWHACLGWCRLVVPRDSRNGNAVASTRLDDDPRWALLRTIRFVDGEPRALRRYRQRGAASAAQSMGVMLSQDGREGKLRELSEDREVYAADPEKTERMLRGRLRRGKLREVERIMAGLVLKRGSIEDAAVHFAVRNNAAMARFHRGVDSLDDVEHEERGPPESGSVLVSAGPVEGAASVA